LFVRYTRHIQVQCNKLEKVIYQEKSKSEKERIWKKSE